MGHLLWYNGTIKSERIDIMGKLQNKKEAFRSLVEEVSKCHVCAQMVTLPHLGGGECLENDDHGLNTDTPYINLWNLWQGNLDADILVIGQDYGQKEHSPDFDRRYGDDSNPTDKNLKELFQSVLKINPDEKKEPLFFTNMANCYRKNSTSGAIHDGCISICANKFMARLIRIVEPKIIIVLGRRAFDAMFCLEGLPLKCTPNPNGLKTDTFEAMLQAFYQLEVNGKTIDVFPVYHPGFYSQKNRSMDLQKMDWERIAKCYQAKKV
ncbi:MAG: hypothetical protein J6B86_01960 [Clostridia bacterium]|nr:hypothetical protein [Clostridia bacterium]